MSRHQSPGSAGLAGSRCDHGWLGGVGLDIVPRVPKAGAAARKESYVKRAFLVSLASLFASIAAQAADLPRRSAPAGAPLASPQFVWTGPYAGINLGYGFGDFTGSGGRRFDDGDGFVGGGQIGYNFQFGNTVVGLETDLQYADIVANNNAAGVTGSKASVDYFGTVRGRLGVGFDRLMPYLTAGFAYGGTTLKIPAAGFGNDDALNIGYTVGGGLEYAITNSITAKIEGLYVDLENESYFNNTLKAGAEFGVVRAGVNAKF